MLSRKSWRTTGGIQLTIIAMAIIALLVPSLVESAVTLIYFRGEGLDRAIELEWATGTEFNTAGFFIRRSESNLGPFEPLENIGFIPGQGDGVLGAEYSVTDSSSIENGKTYWYLLVEIETNNSENSEGPISVTAGLATPTPIPTASATPRPLSTGSQNQETPTVSSTNASTVETSEGTTTPASTSSSNATPTPREISGTSRTNISSEPEEISDSDIEQVVAQEGTPSNGYPPPEEESIIQPPISTTDVSGGYPEPVILPPTNSDYPQPQFQPATSTPQTTNNRSSGDDSQSIGGIGSGNGRPISDDPVEQPASSTIFLWLGFLVALLIFISGVYGSIILFTKQKRTGN